MHQGIVIIVVTLFTTLLSCAIITWCDQGLKAYFKLIDEVDEKTSGSHRNRRD